MARPCFKIEKNYPEPLAGVDEAGCAPLAGPVVAAAVVLDRARFPRGIDDSKALPAKERESVYSKLRKLARIGVGIATVEEIDRLNIYWARMLAMTRAVDALGFDPAMILVDGNRCPKWSRPSHAIVAGDAKCRSIAAASIIAKVTRDRIMADHARQHPGYGWETNKGYPTPEHYSALTRLGLTPLHRRSFAPVRAVSEAAIRPAQQLLEIIPATPPREDETPLILLPGASEAG
ncbi:MAG: ribonuclease HII [Pseudomonadota bacterium]|nr:ribonuclease HII [Pseudomonadota bacterium]